MRRSLVAFAALSTLALIPSQAHAQRSGRGTVNTPYGQFSMREMMAAGGNPVTAEGIREEKQMMQAQQQILKQQQQIAKQQQKARQAYLKQNPKTKSAVTSVPTTGATTTARSKNAQTKSSPTGSTKNAGSTTPKTSHVPGAPTNSN